MSGKKHPREMQCPVEKTHSIPTPGLSSLVSSYTFLLRQPLTTKLILKIASQVVHMGEHFCKLLFL